MTAWNVYEFEKHPEVKSLILEAHNWSSRSVLTKEQNKIVHEEVVRRVRLMWANATPSIKYEYERKAVEEAAK